MTDSQGYVKYTTDSGLEIELSISIIKNTLLGQIGHLFTDQEILKFIYLCYYQKLNPFLKEVYLLKSESGSTTIVVGKDLFTKRAAADERCLGWEAGLIIRREEKIFSRKGAFIAPEEELLGGYAKVYRLGFENPIETSVSLQEYRRLNSQNSWNIMPATMIRKVALVQALRESFPDRFQGLYAPEETGITIDSNESISDCQKTDTTMKKNKSTNENDKEIDWKNEYVKLATLNGLASSELKNIAEIISKKEWSKIQNRTFKSLAEKFKNDGKKAADDARNWLKNQDN